jgi:enoyl-CoA hydratase/carnithine racemase
VLTLDRPERANAVNEAIHDGLVAQLESAAREEDVRAAILAALREMLLRRRRPEGIFRARPGNASARRRALLVRTLEALIDFPKPLVAAVQAQALGAA